MPSVKMYKISLSYALVYVYTILLLSTLSVGQCPQQCTCSNSQVKCYGSQKFPLNLPLDTTNIAIVCSSMLGTDQRPIQHSGTITKIPEHALQGLGKLKNFKISACPINKMPPEAFTRMDQLKSVEIEDTYLTSLEGDLFMGSYNLQSFKIYASPDLIKMDPILFAGQAKLATIKMSDISLPGSAVGEAIAYLKETLRTFIWNRNKVSVIIPQNTFQDFDLMELNFQNNNLINLEFLKATKARKLILSHNQQMPQPFNFSHCPRLSFTKHLDMSYTNLYSLTPHQMDVFTRLETLILGNNQLRYVDGEVFAKMKRLDRLDLSNNKLTTIPNNFDNYVMWSVAPVVNVIGNAYHCNCELNWLKIKYPKLAKDIVCTSGNPVDTKGRTLNSLTTSPLCDAPTKPVIVAEMGKSKIQSESSGAYSIRIHKDETLGLTCTSRGDPAPQMIVGLPNGSEMQHRPPENRNEQTNQIILRIPQHSMKAVEEVMYCRASNLQGTSQLTLRVVNADYTNKEDYGEEKVVKSKTHKKKNGTDQRGKIMPLSWLITINLCYFIVFKR